MMDKFKNQTIAELPEKLRKIRDAAVEHVLSDSLLPKDLSELQNWFATDGWGYVTDSWINDDAVLDLKSWVAYQFLDSLLRSEEDLDESIEITNQMRIKYARSAIKNAIEEYDGYDNPSVHSVLIQREDGKNAILGCTVEIHGQSGPVPIWHGVFASVDIFYAHLREAGFLFHKEADLISDAEIMSFWRIE